MKTILLLFFFSLTILTYSQSEREIIKQIDSINTSALLSYNNNHIVEAFNEFNIANRIADSINDNYGKAISSFNLGNIYKLMRENFDAELSYLSMLKAAKSINDNYLIANAYLNLAILKKYSNNTDDATDFFKKALRFIPDYKSLRDENYNINQYNNLLVKIYVDFTNFYVENNNLDAAYVNILKLEDIIKKESYSNDYYLASFNYTYGLYFFNKELHNSANKKFNKAIAYLNTEKGLKTDHCSLLSKIYKKASLSYFALGNKEQAYITLLKSDEHNEKSLNKEKVKQNVIEKSKFLLSSYKNEVQLANSEKIYQLQLAEKIKKINFIIISALILLMISLVVLYKYYLSKRKLSTVLKTQNEALMLAKNEALKSSEMKSSFISNVSHELRTPLYGVVGLTSVMLENNNFIERDVKYLKSLKYSGDYLLNLINDILQVGKIESNKVELNNTSVNLKALIQNVTDSFDYSLEESNNQIHILIDDCIPEYILCDKIRLTQVLFNLIGNSIKFTQNGNIYVKAILQDNDEAQVSIRFEVNDDGPGIPEDKQKAIFENFTQLNENSNTNYQGAGLGLSIASKIVGLFDSKIELQSQLGVGSTFSFNAKFQIDLNAIKNTESKEVKSIFSNSRPEQIKVLIAEDNKINQIVTSNLLKKQNIEFDIVENGLEALNAFQKNTYNLILMDLNMPLMGGKEATIKIREINKEIPIVALTASSIDELNSDKFDVGFDDIITKPFDNDLFFNTINKLIELSKSKNKKDNKETDKGEEVIELAS